MVDERVGPGTCLLEGAARPHRRGLLDVLRSPRLATLALLSVPLVLALSPGRSPRVFPPDDPVAGPHVTLNPPRFDAPREPVRTISIRVPTIDAPEPDAPDLKDWLPADRGLPRGAALTFRDAVSSPRGRLVGPADRPFRDRVRTLSSRP